MICAVQRFPLSLAPSRTYFPGARPREPYILRPPAGSFPWRRVSPVAPRPVVGEGGVLMHPSRPHHARFLSALVLIAFMKLPSVCLAAPVKDANPHGGGNGNPGVLPLGTSAFGHTY